VTRSEPRERERIAPRTSVVAVLDKRGRFMIGDPFFGRGPQLIVDRDRRAGVGDLVLLRVGGRGGQGGRGHAKVERRIGRPDVARDVLEALMLDRGLRRRFDPAVERAARMAAEGDGVAHHARRDLRDLTTFTIDPATAKDFDDAISAERRGEGAWRIWVHIADVSAYVRPGSLVDKEAYRRGTSVYVPGRVEPMLPEALSNGACSLRPGEDRNAVTVEIDLRGTEVERTAFYRSTIRSDMRLDYDQVDRIFALREEARAPWAEPLAAAREASAALQAEREREGALAIESAEPDFAFDSQGHVTAQHRVVQTEAHRLIEHLMILANEQVAKLLSERKAPTLYRVHERPEGEAAERLVAQLASLDVPTPPTGGWDGITPQQAAETIAACSHLVEQHVQRIGHGGIGLSSLVLRSLKQARYDPANLGHTGLGLTHYCHFTSPIRRYPDLVCHRALLSAVGAGEEAPRASGLPGAGDWCSARERDAMSIERAADDVARAFLLERELFERGWEQDFEGEVTGVIGAGAFVVFGDGHEGMLPVRKLRGEWWELNEEGTILEGTRSGGAIRIGDRVRVQVERVDTARGRVDLLPVEL
jgi:ribonuclease R